ncbi:MAG: non-ribosomal peptide synthetase, partial [Verrucomicrobiota bacterium]
PHFGEFAKAEVEKDSRRKPSDDFWESRFEDPVPPLALPRDGDQPGNRDRGFRCKTVCESIDSVTLSKLRKHSSESGATMFGLLLGAYQILLGRLGRQDRIMTPFPLSGQGASFENDDLVGQCVNFIPFVGKVDSSLTFSEYLQNTQANLLEAYDHQDYTFGRLLRHLPAEKRPTLEAAFKYELRQRYDEFEGLTTDLHEVSANYLFYPLFLDVLEDDEELKIQFTYQTERFSWEMVSQWIQSYRAILESIADSPDARVSEIGSSMTESQWQQLANWNNTKTDYPGDRTVVSLFDEVVSDQPEAIALRWDGGEVTYRELQSQSSRVAQFLSARNVSEGDRVGLFLDRSPERLAAILGIVKLGAAYVPIDPEYPAERLELILEDSEPAMIISQDSLASRLPDGAETVIEIQDALGGDARVPIPETFRGESSKTALCIMYTSGSTGTPKGAVYAHRGLIRAIRNINYCNLSPEETILHTSSICFDVSTFEMFGALLNGATLAIPPAEPLSLGTIADCISRHHVTALWLTSGLFQLMVEEELHAFKGVGQLLSGGDIVPVRHARAVMNAHPGLKLINCYGPTENTTYTTAHEITHADLDRQALPVGAPINNSTAWILDENQRPLSPGMAGELYCGGDGVCLGYLNKPELTAERFVKVQLHPDRPPERLYRTGDLCRYLADGTIDFIGRMDHQVKIRGFRVEPGEIETCLSSYPHVGQCKVVAHGENATEKALIAYVSPLNGYRPTSEELREYSHRKLPAYMVPASMVILDELPVNTNGKIDTKALPIPGTEALLESASSPIADDIEGRLKTLWEKTLKIDSIGSDDDFFALGGHSLLGMKL